MTPQELAALIEKAKHETPEAEKPAPKKKGRPKGNKNKPIVSYTAEDTVNDILKDAPRKEAPAQQETPDESPPNRKDIVGAIQESRQQIADISYDLESLQREVDRIQDGVLAEYLKHGQASMETAGQWLDILSDPEVIKRKVEKSFPEKIAITFAILSDQGLKRLKEAKEYIESIKRIIKPPTPTIEIHQLKPEDVYKEQGELIPASRVLEVREDGSILGTPIEQEVTIRGRTGKITQVIATFQESGGNPPHQANA